MCAAYSRSDSALAADADAPGWRAELALTYERRGGRSVLAARRHDGPLVVQKTLYPEGDGVCHTIVVHPPGGIAGGDDIQLSARLKSGAQALLTTPGAGKWYRSAGPWARQTIRFELDEDTALEWLPQENIVFAGARAELSMEVRLKGDASFIAWEVFCLGRTGAGESFTHGALRARTRIERDGRPLWFEQARLDGGGAALHSAIVMAGQPVAATLMAVSRRLDMALLRACREPKPATGMGGVTLLDGVLIGRYLGPSSEAAKNYFIALWRILRPALMARQAVEPRIWRT